MSSAEGLPQQTKYLQSVFDYDFIQTQFGKSALQSLEGIPDGSFPRVRQRETPGIIASKTTALQFISQGLFVREALWEAIILAFIQLSISTLIHRQQVADAGERTKFTHRKHDWLYIQKLKGQWCRG